MPNNLLCSLLLQSFLETLSDSRSWEDSIISNLQYSPLAEFLGKFTKQVLQAATVWPDTVASILPLDQLPIFPSDLNLDQRRNVLALLIDSINDTICDTNDEELGQFVATCHNIRGDSFKDSLILLTGSFFIKDYLMLLQNLEFIQALKILAVGIPASQKAALIEESFLTLFQKKIQIQDEWSDMIFEIAFTFLKYKGPSVWFYNFKGQCDHFRFLEFQKLPRCSWISKLPISFVKDTAKCWTNFASTVAQESSSNFAALIVFLFLGSENVSYSWQTRVIDDIIREHAAALDSIFGQIWKDNLKKGLKALFETLLDPASINETFCCLTECVIKESDRIGIHKTIGDMHIGHLIMGFLERPTKKLSPSSIGTDLMITIDSLDSLTVGNVVIGYIKTIAKLDFKQHGLYDILGDMAANKWTGTQSSAKDIIQAVRKKFGAVLPRLSSIHLALVEPFVTFLLSHPQRVGAFCQKVGKKYVNESMNQNRWERKNIWIYIVKQLVREADILALYGLQIADLILRPDLRGNHSLIRPLNLANIIESILINDYEMLFRSLPCSQEIELMIKSYKNGSMIGTLSQLFIVLLIL